MTPEQQRRAIRDVGSRLAALVRERMERQRAEQQQHDDEHDTPESSDVND